MSRQNPSDQSNLHQWELYNSAPRERRQNVVSENETIYGEAPSGAHEAEPRWHIWKETRDEQGRITVLHAQGGINTLYWIYSTIAFDPVPDLTGKPYWIELDNNIVYDGMGAGLPVANITVLDVDDITHVITDVFDPFNKFTVVGNVLTLTDSVQLIDIAYPLKLKAVDGDGNVYMQTFAIYVQDMPPVVPPNFTGEINDFQEDLVASASTATLIDYTVPSNRELRMRLVDCFGKNQGKFWVEIDGNKVAEKETYWTYYETKFDFDNFEVTSGENIKVFVENKGINTALFNARLRGYQYAI
jgi:hypothetical protein